MNSLKFELGQVVKLSESEESGKVIGRAEYASCPPTYLIRYVAKDGGQVERWWNDDAIEAV